MFFFFIFTAKEITQGRQKGGWGETERNSQINKEKSIGIFLSTRRVNEVTWGEEGAWRCVEKEKKNAVVRGRLKEGGREAAILRVGEDRE